MVIGGTESGGTKRAAAVANNPLDIVERKIISTKDPNSTKPEIVSCRSNLQISGLGVGSFGPLVLNPASTEYGLLVAESKKGWKDVNVIKALSIINSNIIIDTDVNAAAIGEYRYGAGQNFETLVYVTVGTGIGVGVLLDGKPHVGNFHLEIGHMLIPNSDDFQGVCEIHGNCWEGLASGPSMESRWGLAASELSNSHEAWKKEADFVSKGFSEHNLQSFS
jgi:Transcriptional regulator/sugar kinase